MELVSRLNRDAPHARHEVDELLETREGLLAAEAKGVEA